MYTYCMYMYSEQLISKIIHNYFHPFKYIKDTHKYIYAHNKLNTQYVIGTVVILRQTLSILSIYLSYCICYNEKYCKHYVQH